LIFRRPALKATWYIFIRRGLPCGKLCGSRFFLFAFQMKAEIDMEVSENMGQQQTLGSVRNSPLPHILDEVVKRLLTPDHTNTDGFAIAFHMMQKLENSFQTM